ncbi:hypothetical protein J2W76_004920 [Methylorubrum zatmanii]|nr:hypothetical protein [Methylorubrum zatmanii]MCP1556533.1 hypothetical protein [Methylorubrum extorquens]MCP1581806.1 hypothetical protein [Methylorubrum extorquens]
MTRFVFGTSVWLCGVSLLFYVGLVVINRTGDGRRFNGIVLEGNWHLTLPGLALVAIGHRIISRARLRR